MLLNIGVSDKRRCIDEERKRVRERLFLRQGRRETKFVYYVTYFLNMIVYILHNREELEDIQQQWLIYIEKWENKHMGNYRRIYPGPDTEKYDKYFNNSGTLFSETAASKARLEQAK
jgi:tubulin polyglutamylase TTLL6/13